jgi:hypothetical protein
VDLVIGSVECGEREEGGAVVGCATIEMVGHFPSLSIKPRIGIHLIVSNSVTHSATHGSTRIHLKDNASNFTQIERTIIGATLDAKKPVVKHLLLFEKTLRQNKKSNHIHNTSRVGDIAVSNSKHEQNSDISN